MLPSGELFREMPSAWGVEDGADMFVFLIGWP